VLPLVWPQTRNHSKCTYNNQIQNNSGDVVATTVLNLVINLVTTGSACTY